MTYKKNFVAAIKVGGKILRESKDKVELPFGTEYSILLKNLDTVRMQARISIDGKDATGWLVIPAHQDIEVERFVKDLNSGNRFKFIERTEHIEDHRGIGVEDGLVRVEFKREKIFAPLQPVYHYHYNYWCPYGSYPWITYTTNSGGIQAAGSTLNSLSQAQCNTNVAMRSSSGAKPFVQAMNMAMQSAEPINWNETGITVPGSISDQRFYEVPDFDTDSSEVVVLHLVGGTSAKPVKIAKTVKTKIQCETCGKRNKSNVKFCSECGTSLERV